MGKILDRLKSNEILVSDGAWGTVLHEKGLAVGECPELWNRDHPDVIVEIAESYIDAGSDLIETNSFGASPAKLAHYGLKSRAFELNKKSAELSRKAAGPDHFVLGSVGPTGRVLMMGEISENEVMDGFRIQAKALEQGGVDAIMIETMNDLEEAKLAVQAAKEETDCEVFCTMTFNKSKKGTFHSMMGVIPVDMLKVLPAAGAELIGTNCGNGMKDMVGIVKQIRQADANIPILVHANAGLPVYRDGQTVFPETPEEMAARVPDIIKAGANIIGGCCGTTPEHIRAIAKVIKG